MKTRKSIVTLLIMLMIFMFGITAPEYEVKAVSTGTLVNVLKAPKAASGSWKTTSKGRRYKFKKSGSYAKKRWLKIGSKYYYFTIAGYAKVGMLNYNNRNYYLNSKGALVKGWKTIGGKKYYFWKSSAQGAKAGSAAVGKVTISGNTYYFNSQGQMMTGWVQIGSDYYYFKPSNGRMAVNTTIGIYKVDAQGKRYIPVTSATPAKKGNVDIWVGDSRTVGLGYAQGISAKCIASVGQGYSWYVSTAEAQLKAKLNAKPTAVVVFNLGVNDIDNYNLYIARYKSLMQKYPKASFYFMSVNPINFKKYTASWITDKKIQSFNNAFKKVFPNQYIDTYTMLKPYIDPSGKNYKSGYTDAAGLHYTNDIYKKIYEFVLTKV